MSATHSGFAAKSERLRMMKRRATGLLIAMALLLVWVIWLRTQYPAWGWLGFVEAFAEAALVGGLADWFAVTALFRQPLNLPIPHTAIIPKNKHRIADSLGEFIEAHFLSTERIMAKVGEFNPALQLSRWLQNPTNARQSAEQISNLFHYILQSLTEPVMQARLRQLLHTQLSKLDLAAPAGQILGFIRQSGQHQQLLDAVLSHLDEQLQKPELQQHLAGIIAAELDYLKWIALDEAGGRYLARKLVHAAAREVQGMRDNDRHALRVHFDDTLAQLQERLKNEPELQARLAAAQHKMLAEPAVMNGLDAIWANVVSALAAELKAPDSMLHSKLASGLSHLAQRLELDPSLSDWLNRHARIAAGQLVKRYRHQIGLFIAEQLKAWDDEVMVERLEVNVGVDLQFVRLNGTLVGGLIGLLLYGLHQLII
ncbi:DUF445 domain-containing protein [Chitinibacter bivalviorum]|uniref:DUF445 domain-containing protein n=1 Tax=Chitinibacter bivalviorum TaxID=2739434 RepID=A0A7H9BEZ2_9NEIS|nr:DUF445 domain-containing protein [Chitinibacter bivalviorum]QLG87273.1 DUF445 domain-containing protein [Chitinibacter bivalviorum]